MTVSPPTSTPALPQQLEGGTVVGRYVIDGWLRNGGMASLYRGHHAKTGAKVAIKVQLGRVTDDLVTAARFDREGQVMGRLSGVPQVAQVHDVDALPDGRRYLVMEWIEGDNLEELLDDLRNADHRMDVERACRLMKDVALALAAVHRAEVVHRDLKPSNIMIDHGHDREVAKLVDFGISADLGVGAGSVDLTATGVVLGTSGYVAPEQALGLPAHPSFDVYAFGVVLFEALTGYAAPPDGLVVERLPPIGTLRASVPPELAELVVACLQRDPSKRPPSAEALVERLDGVIRGLSRSTHGKTRSSAVKSAVVARALDDARASSSDEPVERGTRAHGDREEGEDRDQRAEPSEELLDAPPRAEGSERLQGRRWALAAVIVGALAVAAVALVVSRCVPRGTDGPHRAAEASTGRNVPAGDALAEASGGSDTGPSIPVPSTGAESTTAVGSTAAEASSTGPAATDSGSEPVPPHKDPHKDGLACEQARRRARTLAEARKWSAVLRATADRPCWATTAQRNERTAMRVKSFLELQSFEQCVEAGKGSTDPNVARMTKLCRTRASKESE